MTELTYVCMLGHYQEVTARPAQLSYTRYTAQLEANAECHAYMQWQRMHPIRRAAQQQKPVMADD